MKKIYVVISCIAMMLFAAVSVQASSERSALSVETVTAEAGDSVEVPVTISDNVGICGATISVSYDEKLDLTDVKSGEALSGLTMTKPGDYTANPIRVLWYGDKADDSNGVITTLVFTVPESSGNYPIVVTYEEGDIINGNLETVELEIINGSITVGDTRSDEEQVEDLVNSIHQMDPSDRKAVEEIRLIYNGMSDEQKALVPEEVLKKLTDAEELFRAEDEEKQGNLQAVAQVEDLIHHLDPDDEESIRNAYVDYYALTEDQKAMIDPEVVKKLEEAIRALSDEEDWEWDEWTVEKEPTCEEAGTEVRVNHLVPTLVERREMEALGHNLTVVEETLPDCEKEGNTEYWHCEVCEKNFASMGGTDELTAEEIMIPALGHSWDEGKVMKERTCESDGEVIYTCQRDASHIRTEVLPALGHDLTFIEEVPAGCELAGNFAYWHCEICHKNFANSDGTGELTADQIEIAATGHIWDAGIITQKATPDNPGMRTYTCENCGQTKAEPYEYLEETVIHPYAFAGNLGLEEFTIGASITEIGDNAFYGCENLKKIYFEGDMPLIGNHVFDGIPNDAEIYFPVGNSTWNQDALNEKVPGIKAISWEPQTGGIVRTDLSDCTVSLDTVSYVYDGNPKKPGVTVIYDGKKMEENVDYTVTYGKNTSAGSGTVLVTGKNNYAGEAELTFLITKAKGQLKVPETEIYKKCGDESFDLKPSELLTDGTVKFTSSNASVADIDQATGRVTVKAGGTAVLTVKAEGVNYTTESASVTLVVEKRDNEISVSDRTVEGTGRKQKVKLEASALDGEVTYQSGNKKIKVTKEGNVVIPKTFAGKVTITVKTAETDKYKAASAEAAIIVTPKPTPITGVKNSASKRMTVTWKKNNTAKGYELQYSTNKKFKKNLKTVSVNKQKTVKKVIKKLKKGKTYYVRLRAYITVGQERYYSSWSKVKKVKISK